MVGEAWSANEGNITHILPESIENLNVESSQLKYEIYGVYSIKKVKREQHLQVKMRAVNWNTKSIEIG